MTFDQPFFFWAGVGVSGLVVIALLLEARRRSRLAEHLGGGRAVRRLAGPNLYRCRIDRALALGVATLAIGAAAAGLRLTPASEGERREQEVDRRSAVIALDVSASMQAGDVSPTRMARAVEIGSTLVRGAGESRIGVLLFAGKGYVLVPPTADLDAVEFLVEGVDASTVSAQDPGSLISAAIGGASTLLGQEGERADERSIVVISDGEAGEGDSEVIEAVREAASQGIAVHVVGVGTERGERLGPFGSRAGPRTPGSATGGISRLQEPLLQRMAEAGGGRYSRGESAGGIERVTRAIHTEELARAGEAPVSGRELGVPLIALSLLLLVTDGIAEAAGRGLRPRSMRGRA